jgi:hypothetical protein
MVTTIYTMIELTYIYRYVDAAWMTGFAKPFGVGNNAPPIDRSEDLGTAH